MQYRTLGRTDLQVSEVSLGTEYLIGKSPELIGTVIHAALDNGINYFDLFYASADFRDAMGTAFQEHRKQVYLAAHLGAAVKDGQYHKTRNPKTCKLFFDDFLDRYRTDYVDVLILHNCDTQKDFDQLFRENGPLGMALQLKAEGKARFLGFSGHTIETARQAVESGHIDVLMFPVNLTGNAIPGKRELFMTCVAQGVGIVAMKPYGGGKLLQDQRTVQVARYQTGGGTVKVKKATPITPVQCLAYTLSQVGVCAAIPGCESVAHVEDALAYEQASDEERDFSAVLGDFEKYISGECVYCNHCLPCPAHIDIGQTLRLLDMAESEQSPALRAAYAALPVKASACTTCGACEKRCPFGVATVSKIQQAAAQLG